MSQELTVAIIREAVAQLRAAKPLPLPDVRIELMLYQRHGYACVVVVGNSRVIAMFSPNAFTIKELEEMPRFMS